MHGDTLFAGVTLERHGTLRRLIHELAEAAIQFRSDPRSFIRNSFNTGGATSGQRTNLLRLGLGISVILYSIGFTSMLLWWSTHQAEDPGKTAPYIICHLPPSQRPPDLNEVADRSKNGGGGGGGSESAGLPSPGQRPIFAPFPQLIAPTPRPTVNPPSIPMAETLFVDPRLQPPRDSLTPTGVPNALPAPPSPGLGSDAGLGGGRGGGAEGGDGPGVGPGLGGNTGGGPYTVGGNSSPSDRSQSVDSRPHLLNNPRPFYTEEARIHKIQGTVRAKLLVGADGTVKEVVVLTGLSNGLTEQAIKAAYQMRFSPAMKAGRPLSYWLSNVAIEFNLR